MVAVCGDHQEKTAKKVGSNALSEQTPLVGRNPVCRVTPTDPIFPAAVRTGWLCVSGKIRPWVKPWASKNIIYLSTE